MPKFAGGIIRTSRRKGEGIEPEGARAPTAEGESNPFPPPLRVEFISDPRRLEQLEPDWHALWSAIPGATPFQSPDWILQWWRHYGEGRLFSFALWSNDQLAGLAPLYIYEKETDPARRIFLLGTGNSDYLDAIFRPEFRRSCWKAVVAEIANRQGLWDECDFHRLRPDSPLLQGLGGETRFIANSTEEEPCVTLDLSPATPTDRMLKTTNTYARKLQEKEGFSIEHATAASLEELLSAFEQLHQRRWNAKGCAGVLSEDRDRSFHHEVASRSLKAGTLMCYAMRIQGKIVSVVYGFRHRDRTYSYLTGFDPDYRRHSVGAILVGHAIRQSMEQHRSFDFLKGQEPYKYRWGGHDEVVLGRTICKRDDQRHRKIQMP